MMSTAFALVAAFLFAVAATFQQKGALELGISSDSLRAFAELGRSSWWLLGTGALLVGYVAQAIALDHGRVSIVQPILVSTVVFALPLGYVFTAQHVASRQIAGAGAVVLGLAFYAVFGDPAGGRDNAPNGEWAVALLLVAAVCGALLLIGRKGQRARKAATIGVVSGILFGTSACLVKPVLGMLDNGVGTVLSHWEVYAMAISGVLAFVLQQVSLSEGFLATSVATVSVANPIVSILIGITLFDERLSDPAWHKIAAIVGLGIAGLGAVAISIAREGTGERAPDGRTAPQAA